MHYLIINGDKVPFVDNQTILDAASVAGITLPTLCSTSSMRCGECDLNVAEDLATGELISISQTVATDGLDLSTESPRAFQARQDKLTSIFSTGAHNCFSAKLPDQKCAPGHIQARELKWHDRECPAKGACTLQKLAGKHKVKVKDIPLNIETPVVDDRSPFIARDYSRCIKCGECIAVCREVGQYAISRQSYNDTWHPSVDLDKCTHCGQCLEACPVGALFDKKAFGVPKKSISKVQTTCPYCGTGCQLQLHVKDERIFKVTADEGVKPNNGRLCVKGRFGYDFIYSEKRLKTPLIKENGEFREASWDEALDLVANKIEQIRDEHGPDAIAGLSCARSLTEDSYNMQKLFRASIGTNNIDHCARTCHAPSVVGLATMLGSGAMSNNFDDIDKAKTLLVIGSNMTVAHPVIATFVHNAVQRDAKLVVIDPRATKLTEWADMHLPLKVGSDVALINSIMNVLIREDLYDKEYVEAWTEGFEALKEAAFRYPPEETEDITGIPAEQVVELARLLGRSKPAMLLYTLGITEHTSGVHNVFSCANLQLLLGNIGVPGGGVNPLRGQNNVQGACDAGALPNTFPGYGKVTDAKARRKFERAWNVPSLPANEGLRLPAMIEGLKTGKVRMLYVFGEDPATTEPDMRHVHECLSSAEFIVCNDIFPTKTTQYADVIFPSAAWSEDEGTFTNTERRVGRVRKVSPPPGEARPNWWIFRELAKRLGDTWASTSGREIWENEMAKQWPAITGITYDRLEKESLQWPVPHETHPGTPWLFKETPKLFRNVRFTMGKALLQPLDWTPPAEVPDKKYPLVLSTGRRLYHYNCASQTSHAVGLNDLLSEEIADISPQDARHLGFDSGDIIRLSTRRGTITVKARVTEEVPRGMVWMAFHFYKNNSNWLTNSAADPISDTAEYKACAVRIDYPAG